MKTTTSGLLADYEHEGSPLPRPGLRQAVIDSAGNRVAVIETTAVRVIRLGDVDLAHALGEGEGFTSVCVPHETALPTGHGPTASRHRGRSESCKRASVAGSNRQPG